MVPDITLYQKWFEQYVVPYAQADSEDRQYIDLKRDHTLRVFDNAKQIAASLSLTSRDMKVALLGALFHDVGRFEQFRMYKTYSDRNSVNHGLLGSRILKYENVLAKEPKEIQHAVRATVAMHNKLALPKGLPEHIRIATNIVRDSDKLDIFPVLVSNFTHDGSKSDVVTMGLEEGATKYTRQVLYKLLHGESIRYDDMRYVNDFKLLLASWVFGLEYGVSMQLLHQRGIMERLLDTLPALPEMEKVKRVVREEMERVLAEDCFGEEGE
ncbi:HD domain-containing protein [Halodesulfovibrio aestuarii]|uniref:HDIG domain-containing protein n=1 Tax=Halodesulfovibrio aestuarii TaxID=126333 RepID=A0A8G2C738_9BACT|nr:HD domain-containing protein [Halodesulfovibrio aestuarii]SHI56785.1 HDIG domain-containing protein [Halodesulfovibrio aestuarii]